MYADNNDLMEKKGLEQWVEEFILALIILLNVLDFFEILPGDMDYAKKIISWSALGYLLYKVSLTRIFFNDRKKFIDLAIIISYFFLIFKNLIVYSKLNLENFYLFYEFHKFIMENALMLDYYSFIIGGCGILLIALYCTFSIKIQKPSLVDVFYEWLLPPEKVLEKTIKFISIFFVLTGFFVVVFNLVMEWLAIAIDAPIVMIGILVYVFVLIRHYQKFDVDSFIYRIGEIGESFYENFINLFHYRHTLFLGVTGMLVLHLLTDLGNFFIPYLTGFREGFYLEHLGPGHTPLIFLFIEQIKNVEIFEIIPLFSIYLLNLFALFLLLIIPAYLWRIMFNNKEIKVSRFTLSLAFVSFIAFFLAPVFKVKGLFESSFVGVDILTNFANNFLFDYFYKLFLFLIIVFLILFFISKYIKKVFLFLGFSVGVLSFMTYIIIFFVSVLFYYFNVIKYFFSENMYFHLFYFGVFMIITIIFYISGFLLFVDDVIKFKVYKKII